MCQYTTTCLYCGLLLIKKKKKQSFCSNQCKRNQDYRVYINRWLLGEVSGYRGGGHVSAFVIRYIKAQKGEQCWQCGWCERNPVSKRIPIEIDHIDGNYKNCHQDNVRLLCPNCHALTPTYKNLNKGKGRNLKVLWQES